MKLIVMGAVVFAFAIVSQVHLLFCDFSILTLSQNKTWEEINYFYDRLLRALSPGYYDLGMIFSLEICV